MSYENEISFKITHGEQTEFLFDEFCYGDPFEVEESIDIREIEKANMLNDRPVFLEGVIQRFSDKGLSFEMSDTDSLIARHCYSDVQQYKTAKRKIAVLVEEHRIGSLADLHADLVGFKYQSIVGQYT